MPAVVIRLGDSGPAVAEVRDRLVRLGLLTHEQADASDTFDDTLFGAVKVFQQQRGLTVDGIVGPQTFRRLEESRWSLGDRVLTYQVAHPIHGDDVAVLQQRLMGLGFHVIRVDGVFEESTDRVVREFQRNYGLNPDGIVGPEVFTALTRLVNSISGGSQEHLRELASWDNNARAETTEPFLIMLDPSDSQKRLADSQLTEAAVCWDIATRLEGRLIAAGFNVLFTHPQDGNAPDERARAQAANEADVDLVLSLRLDWHDNSSASGIASYYFGHAFSRSATGARFADLVQEEIGHLHLLTDARSHQKTWDLLRLTRMPACRVELGYSSSVKDSRVLSDANSRDAIAGALHQAVSRIAAPKIG